MPAVGGQTRPMVTQVQFGRIHGFGTYTWRTDSKYVGQWKEGKMHGHGIKTDPQGAPLVRVRVRVWVRVRGRVGVKVLGLGRRAPGQG